MTSPDPDRDTTGTAVGTEAGDAAPAARGRRRLRPRQLLAPALSVLIVIAVFWYFLPKFTSISAVWASIQSMTWLQLTILGVAAVWNLATYWFLMVATMPGLTVPQAAVVTQSSTAVSNTVPGGGAIGIAMCYSMYSSWGFSRSRGSVSLLVAGLWNNFAKLGMPVLALALLAFEGGTGGGRLVAGLVGVAGLVAAIAVFGALLRSDGAAGPMAGCPAGTRLRCASPVNARPPSLGTGRGAPPGDGTGTPPACDNGRAIASARVRPASLTRPAPPACRGNARRRPRYRRTAAACHRQGSHREVLPAQPPRQSLRHRRRRRALDFRRRPRSIPEIGL